MLFVVISDAYQFSVGDLGHVTSTNSPQVEEGDSRFLASEVLHEVKNIFYRDIDLSVYLSIYRSIYLDIDLYKISNVYIYLYRYTHTVFT